MQGDRSQGWRQRWVTGEECLLGEEGESWKSLLWLAANALLRQLLTCSLRSQKVGPDGVPPIKRPVTMAVTRLHSELVHCYLAACGHQFQSTEMRGSDLALSQSSVGTMVSLAPLDRYEQRVQLARKIQRQCELRLKGRKMGCCCGAGSMPVLGNSACHGMIKK